MLALLFLEFGTPGPKIGGFFVFVTLTPGKLARMGAFIILFGSKMRKTEADKSKEKGG